MYTTYSATRPYIHYIYTIYSTKTPLCTGSPFIWAHGFVHPLALEVLDKEKSSGAGGRTEPEPALVQAPKVATTSVLQVRSRGCFTESSGCSGPFKVVFWDFGPEGGDYERSAGPESWVFRVFFRMF